MAKARKNGKTAKKNGHEQAEPERLAPPSPRNGNCLNTAKGSHKGGKKGRSGRPPMAFKNFLAKMRSDPDVQGELEDVLRDKDHRHYPSALKTLTDYDDDLPANLTPEERAARIAKFLELAEARRKAAGHAPATPPPGDPK